MLRLIVFIAGMAIIAPELTSIGRPYCGPENFVAWHCGSFWWFVLLVVIPLADVVRALLRAKRAKRAGP